MMETWKPVVGLEGLYEVSNLGSVRSLDRLKGNGTLQRGRVKKQSTENMGYKTVTITNKEGKKKTIKVHRMVAEAFIPRIDGKDIVNHKNGNKTDNEAGNLEWSTQAENIEHARETGLTPLSVNSGSKNVNAKLTEDSVREIRRLHGEYTPKQLAEKYGVKYKSILKVINRESWKHVL